MKVMTFFFNFWEKKKYMWDQLGTTEIGPAITEYLYSKL